MKAILASLRWRVIDRTPYSILKAIELVRERRVPFWDALIAACMIEYEINIIVTETERDFRRIEGITINNPFK